MNTEATQDKSEVTSTGERLRSAREQMGLTQPQVAERLCLKLSTIRDIEENKSPAELASTFLRGYIRAYARLVHVPEEELLPIMAKQMPARTARVEPMQSYSLGKQRKKRDGCLMIFTWIVLLVVIGLTGAWWWQNHKAAQDDLVPTSGLSMNNDDNGQSISLSDNSGAVESHDAALNGMVSHERAAGVQPVNPPVASANSSVAQPAPAQPVASQSATTGGRSGSLPSASSVKGSNNALPANNNSNTANNSTAVNNTHVGNNSNPSSTNSARSLPVTRASVVSPTPEPDVITMSFSASCWLDVTDAKGEKLFSGVQRSGGKLSLTGVAPYRLKIGAPAAVKIQYQGKPVDLSSFIRNNQVARLTLGAH